MSRGHRMIVLAAPIVFALACTTNDELPPSGVAGNPGMGMAGDSGQAGAAGTGGGDVGTAGGPGGTSAGGTSAGTGGTSAGGTGQGGTSVAGTGGGGAAGTGGGGAAASGGRGGTGTGGGGGTSSASCASVAGAASTNADGVLTNYPTLRFTKLRGDIQITTATFKLENLTSFSSVQVWGDLKNNGSRQLCIPLSETFDIGAQDVLVVVDGKPYKSSFSRVTDVCLDPGGTAAYAGIQNNVPPTLLTAASTIAYEFSGIASSTPEIPDPYDPVLLSAEPKQVSLGWALAGQMRSSSMAIYNLAVTIYIRDTNGLLYDDTSAFPLSLGNIPPLTTFDFETYSTPSRFCAYERYDSFIEGTMTLAAFSPDPTDARRSEDQGRKAALRAARSLLQR